MQDEIKSQDLMPWKIAVSAAAAAAAAAAAKSVVNFAA